MRITYLFTVIFTVLSSVSLFATAGVDFNVEGYFSFEKSISPALSSDGSKLSISKLHYKTGEKSLRWDWKKEGASFKLNVPIKYMKENPNPKETSISSFVFWLYSPKEINGNLIFRFLKKGRECCRFTYKLGFEGWRGAWVAFDRDMEGSPEEGMDTIDIQVLGSDKGTLFFDGIIPSAFEDSRYHTPDFQVPYVNKNTDVHWLLLYKNWNKELSEQFLNPSARLQKITEEMQMLEDRFVDLVSGDVRPIEFDKLVKAYNSYKIHRNNDGSIIGKPIFFIRYGETYDNIGVSDAKNQFSASGQLLRDYNDLMFKIAVAYRKTTDWDEKAELEKMYLNMTEHLLDQGFACGSGMGTLHHLGYSMRNFYTAPVIMKEVLLNSGLIKRVQQAMEWFSGAGEVKEPSKLPGVDIDAFNTYLLSRMAAIIMLNDNHYKYAYIKALSYWINNGFKYTSGTLPSFKSDGTIFHHRRAYPAYAVGGLDGAVKAVWLLKGTSFAISENSHNNLKRALMEMRFYCNLRSFPLAMSGRHPDGKGSLAPYQYALLADAGSPDGKEMIDAELARAYLRLCNGKGRWFKKFTSAGYKAENSPEGAKAYGYNSSLSYRKDNWLVTIAGHSRYLWSAEIYNGANLYGRYLTHGSMEILGDSSAGGDKSVISSFGSGYKVPGYDWCHIPGTTAATIPMEEMKANVLNVDKFSGYEEMLLSDQWFAGGVIHDIDNKTGHGKSGAYAMILHENEKYNGSLQAHKSFFAFRNRIICLGSGLKNLKPNSSLNTTLFQNTIDENTITIFNGNEYKKTNVIKEEKQPLNVLKDRFGNMWFVKNSDVVMSRSVQQSLHAETDLPTKGVFEKAFIRHWDVDKDGNVKDSTANCYEYMVAIHPSVSQSADYTKKSPYELLSLTDSLHSVRDLESGTIGAAVFETSKVDSLITEATPCVMMYSYLDSKKVLLSVSNPDLALYSGMADKVYENGRYKERSVYSRNWIDNPCADTKISIKLKGHWTVSSLGKTRLNIVYNEGNTIINIITSEAKTEEIILKNED